MRGRRVMAVPRGRNPAETEFRDRFRARLGAQRVVERLGAIEIAGVEQRVGQLRARRQVVRSAAQRGIETRRGFRRPREALQRDAVEVEPLDRLRRQRLRAEIRLVRGTPLIPCMQRPRERADRTDVGRTRRRRRIRVRQRVARRRRKRVEGEPRKRRKGRLRGSSQYRADSDGSNYQKLNLTPRRICRSG
jgi:hypothetical protein